MFQSTHPHGVRHICTLEPLPPSGFNPRTHTGCDTIKAMRKRKRYRFQSTHPHGVRRTQIILILMCNDVSIHAPTRGATLISLGYLFAVATWFQSTHPHGVRQSCPIFMQRYFNVSIHAPTRGATFGSICFYLWELFQSTHPHGVRQISRINSKGYRIGFNPRTHTGCDHSLGRNIDEPLVSIHAPTRGATERYATFGCAEYVSIHAPTRGATR